MTAIIQTVNPDAPARYLASQTVYETFATNELQFRQGAFVPPAFRMARFIIKDNTFERTAGRADSLRARLQSIEAPGITFSPVAPCVLPRIADRFRFDLTVTSATSQTMQYFLQEARKMSKSARDIAIDVDPLSML